MAPSHYLNLCWLIIRGVLWHSPESNYTRSAHDLSVTCVRRLHFQNYNHISQGPMSMRYFMHRMMSLRCTFHCFHNLMLMQGIYFTEDFFTLIFSSDGTPALHNPVIRSIWYLPMLWHHSCYTTWKFLLWLLCYNLDESRIKFSSDLNVEWEYPEWTGCQQCT